MKRIVYLCLAAVIIVAGFIYVVTRPSKNIRQSPFPGQGQSTFITIKMGEDTEEETLQGLTYSYMKRGLVDLPDPTEYLRDRGAKQYDSRVDGKPEITITESLKDEPHYLISYAGQTYWICSDHFCLRLMNAVDWMAKDWAATRSKSTKK